MDARDDLLSIKRVDYIDGKITIMDNDFVILII